MSISDTIFYKRNEIQHWIDNGFITDSDVKQVETATVAGTITATGKVSVIITAAGMNHSPLTVLVDVVNTDTASIVGGKIRAALALRTDITEFFTISGTTTGVILTKKEAEVNDATLNIALANSTSTGLTAAPTSANTTAGVKPFIASLTAKGILKVNRIYANMSAEDRMVLKLFNKRIFTTKIFTGNAALTTFDVNDTGVLSTASVIVSGAPAAYTQANGIYTLAVAPAAVANNIAITYETYGALDLEMI
jgi:hypothetical protein